MVEDKGFELVRKLENFQNICSQIQVNKNEISHGTCNDIRRFFKLKEGRSWEVLEHDSGWHVFTGRSQENFILQWITIICWNIKRKKEKQSNKKNPIVQQRKKTKHCFMNGKNTTNQMGKQKCLALNRDSLIICASDTWWGEGNWSDAWSEYKG